MPFNCQPPRIVPATLCESFSHGSAYTKPIWNTWVRSKPASREVLVVDERAVVVEPHPAILVRHVLRLAQRVGALQEEALAERPVDGDLQAVVAALGARRPVVDRGVAGEGEVLARGVAAAGRAVVDVQVGIAAIGGGADIRELGRDVERPAVFVGDVPLLDGAAIDLVRIGRADEDALRQLHAARADVGNRHVRNALRQRAQVHELIGRVVEADVERKRAAHRTRPGQRVDRLAVCRRAAPGSP